MNAVVEDKASKCEICNQYRKQNTKEMSGCPWSKVSFDLLELNRKDSISYWWTTIDTPLSPAPLSPSIKQAIVEASVLRTRNDHVIKEPLSSERLVFTIHMAPYPPLFYKSLFVGFNINWISLRWLVLVNMHLTISKEKKKRCNNHQWLLIPSKGYILKPGTMQYN